MVVEGEAEASSVDVHAQPTVAPEMKDPDDRCGEPGGGADAKRQRGPNLSATPPTIGEPKWVPPNASRGPRCLLGNRVSGTG